MWVSVTALPTVVPQNMGSFLVSNAVDFDEIAIFRADARVVPRVFPERAFRHELVGIDLTLDDDLGPGRDGQVYRLALYHLDRLPRMAPTKSSSDTKAEIRAAPLIKKKGVAADDVGDGHRLLHRGILLQHDVRMLSFYELRAEVVLVQELPPVSPRFTQLESVSFVMKKPAVPK